MIKSTSLFFGSPLVLLAVLAAPALAQTKPSAPPAPAPAAPGVIDSNDPLLQPPPLPPGQATLVGGRVAKIDRIRQEFSLHPFGGGQMRVSFDDRTHIFRDGVETTQMGLRKGDKVYVDTLTDHGRVLAKNIRVQATMQTADARGQVVGLRNGRMEIREQLTAEPVRFELAPDTVIHLRDGAGSMADLRPGALVEVRFAPASPDRWIAREVKVLAAPGARFVFAGKVTHIDMRTGTLALLNAADQRSHEVLFDAGNPAYRRVQMGAEVTVEAEFDGARYRAQSLRIDTATP